MKNYSISVVQFGPTQTEEKKSGLQGLVLKYLHLFVLHHQDLLAITLEEHRVEVLPRAKPVCVRQKRMAPDKVRILKNELDKLLGWFHHSSPQHQMGLTYCNSAKEGQ